MRQLQLPGFKVATICLIILSGLSARAQMRLSAGERFSQSFVAATARSAPNEGWPWPGPRVDFAIGGSPEAAWIIELFETTTQSTPSDVVTNQTFFFSLDKTGTNAFSILWDDLEGSYRLTCLAGIIQLTRVSITKCSELKPFEGHWRFVLNDWYWSLERPRLSVLPLSDTQFELRWPMYSPTGDGTRFDEYQVEHSSSPIGPVWTLLSNEVRQVSTDFCLTIERTNSVQFFRLRKN